MAVAHALVDMVRIILLSLTLPFSSPNVQYQLGAVPNAVPTVA
jgi:hypothetical protein